MTAHLHATFVEGCYRCELSRDEMAGDLASIIEDTPDEMFELAGGFGFTDEIAMKLNGKWREQESPVVVAAVDLAWLLDGYARARLAVPAASTYEEGPNG